MQKKKPMKEANDSETLNLEIQPLTGDEINSFAARLRATKIDENIKNNLKMLKQNLDSLNLNI